MAPTTRADNRNKHPGYLVLSKAPLTSPPRTQVKSQLERDAIVNDIAALEDQLRTKQQQSRSVASQPPRPSHVKRPHSKLVRDDFSSGPGASQLTHKDKVLM